jgi:hypothetical protein
LLESSRERREPVARGSASHRHFTEFSFLIRPETFHSWTSTFPASGPLAERLFPQDPPPRRSDRAAPLFVGAMRSRSTNRQVRTPCGHFGQQGFEPCAGDVRFGQAPFWARRPLFVERSGPEGVIDFGITGGSQRSHGRCRPPGHRNTRQHAQLPMRKQSTHGPVTRHGPRHRVTVEETAHRTSDGLRRWSRRGWTLSARSLDCYRLLESVP